jgi:methylenetetrahydrofolate dehydrogenase (NADP+)/methenyltetrahydrofolate cyclohydrolase
MPFYISGKEIADQKEADQAQRVELLKNKGVVPKLVIIQTIDSPVIDVYIRVKKKYAEKIGVLVEHLTISTNEDLEKTIVRINSDVNIHGVIIQLPLNQNLDQDKTLNLIAKKQRCRWVIFWFHIYTTNGASGALAHGRTRW